MTERTHHDLWPDEQATEDFAISTQTLALAAVQLDEDTHSWDGITPADALQRLQRLQAMVTFAVQAVMASSASHHGVSGS
jgi:hypothetical protein